MREFASAAAAATLLAVGVGVSCLVEEHSLTAPRDGGEGPADDGALDIPYHPTNLVDVLFVIDNSGSMREEQATLVDAIPEFLRVLFEAAAGRERDADVQLGVVSTDMGTAGFTVSTCADSERGDDGCLLHAAAAGMTCDESYPSFLSRRGSATGYTLEKLSQDLGCISTLGTAGCGFEQQLEAMRKALTENAAAEKCNEGFVRPGSVVAVVFLTDEDDCSVTARHPEMFDPSRNADLGHLNIRCFLHPEFLNSVDYYVTTLEDLRGEGHALVVGAIVGVPPGEPACAGSGDALGGCLAVPAMEPGVNPAQPTELLPSCDTALGLAFPPVRFVQLAQSFGDRAYVASLCEENYGSLLTAVASRVVDLM
jgi:hypothetical protein